MPKPPRPWIVGKHGPLEKLEEDLWCIEDQVPGTSIRRRMTIVRRADGSLVFYQAIPVDDGTLAEILAWGKPAILVVPHDQHGLDARAFSEKLNVGIHGPKRNSAKMRKKFHLAGTLDGLPDSEVRFESMEGTKTGEPVGIVRSRSGHVSLLFADAFMANASDGLTLGARLLGFGGGAKVAPLFRMFFLKDKAALKAHFERLAAIPGLTRLVPCHGLIESVDPAGALLRVAATL
jgi:hypothetical protein